MYYDVSYISPSGSHGKHYAVEEESPAKAAILSLVMLSASTSFEPKDFSVTGVVPAANTPERAV